MPESHLILVVEDDDELRHTLVELLEEEGYRTLEAANGRSALDLLARQSELPALILLDLMMPVMNGWEFRHAMLGKSFESVPTVVLTASRELEKRPIQAPYVLQKPIHVAELLDLLSKHFG